jgi:hypothetical protein
MPANAGMFAKVVKLAKARREGNTAGTPLISGLSIAAGPTESDSRKASNNLQGHQQQQQELARHYKLLDGHPQRR